MYLIRDVFRCKPGKVNAVAEKFQRSLAVEAEGVPPKPRLLVDAVATYWTLVLETEVEDLAGFERQMQAYRETPAVQEAMAGYMDLVEEGHREIFRIL